MNDWIDLGALGRIVLIGLLCGAGLPALFAVGLRALSAGTSENADERSGGRALTVTAPVDVALAAVCFAIVLAAIGAGIYLIVAGS